MQVSGDEARAGRNGRNEIWRRLSGAGSSPLSGAWESAGPGERWLYLSSAGHFAVARESLDRPLPAHDGRLSDNEVAGLVQGFGANAGARIETRVSFDHWPMVATTNPGAMDCRKHETFRLHRVEGDRFEAGFAPDGSDSVEWRRLR
jgi:hypothetical protein